MYPEPRSNKTRNLYPIAFIKGASLLLLFVLLLTVQPIPTAHAEAGVVHVDITSGGDTLSCGSVGTPCKSIAYALENRATSGDTLRVAQGIYVENLTVDKQIVLEGGYEAVGWTRDLDRNETIIDGSNSRTVTGDWDGRGIQSSAVITAGGEYKMWYRGIDLTSTGFGLATSPDGMAWTKYAGNPVMEITEEWEEGGFSHPHVIKDGPIYKMWYSIGDHKVGYATSSDGISWTKYADNPIMAGTPGAWDADGVSAPFVIKVGPSEFRMWYQDQNYSQIGYATSPDGLVWTKEAGPVLTQGPRDTWDDERVNDPNVVLIGATYHIWYGGNDGDNVRIGHAVSPDGVNWTKSTENPILAAGPAGAWDDASIAEPNVLYSGGLYHMWYSGWQNSWNNAERGYATSPDGLNWTKYAGNPVLSPGAISAWGKPVVHFFSSSDGSVLSAFTVRNGDAEDGGGIFIASAEVTIESCKVVDNHAYDSGGGIRVSYAGASAIISDTQVLNNEAGNSGGGVTIRYDASVELIDSIVAQNRAKWDGGGIEIVNSAVSVRNSDIHANTNRGAGGGIYIGDRSTVTVEGNRIWENTVDGWAAGGIFVGQGSTAGIFSNEILSNTVNDNGGGILVFDDATEAEIRDNTIQGNRARGGGGIQVSNDATAEIHSNTIVDNSAIEWDGAGLKFEGRADVRMSHNLIAHNTTPDQGSTAIQIMGDSAVAANANTIVNNGNSHDCVSIGDNFAPVNLTNNIIANNDCKGIFIGKNTQNITIINNTIASNKLDGILVWGPTASVALIRNNIVANSAYGINTGDGGTIILMDYNNSYGNERGDYDSAISEANNISQDPLFMDAANGDYRLRFGSPSIDSGTASDAPDHDLLGNERPQGNGVDMGAYEMTYPKVYLPLVSTAASCLTPIPVSPTDGSGLDTLVPLFQFRSASEPNVTLSQLAIYKDPEMTRFVAGMGSPPQSGVQERLLFKNLDPGTTYFWKMYSECGGEQSREIGPLRFTTGVGGDIPYPPDLRSPANNSTIPGTEVTWQWQEVTGAIDYNIRYREIDDEDWQYREITHTPATQRTFDLSPDTTYVWWVIARNGYAYGEESTKWTFSTAR